MATRVFDYREGITVNKDAEPGAIDAKAPYRDYGTEKITTDRYRSKDRSDMEWERMWTKVWILAGVASDIPNVGDYFRYDVGPESFVVVRTDAESIRAFYNVCPHRGNEIVSADFGTVTNCFKCAFHGWRFNLDGSLAEIRDEETFRPEVIADRPGLKEVACDIWNGIVFISMNPNPEPLLDYLGVIPEHLGAFPIADMRTFVDTEVEVAANWKLNMEAFIEFYHAWDVHPEVAPVTETYHIQYDCYDKGVSRMLMPFGYAPDKLPNPEEVNEGLKMMVRAFGGDPEEYSHLTGDKWKPAVIETKRKWGKKFGISSWDNLTDDQMVDDWNYSVFPNVTLNVFADVLMIQRWTPHPTDPTKSIYNALQVNLPVPQDPNYRIMDLGGMDPDKGNLGPVGFDGSVRPPRRRPTELRDFGYILEQDCRLVPRVQRGATSRAFEGYRLSEQEIRIRHYLAELDLYLKGERP